MEKKKFDGIAQLSPKSSTRFSQAFYITRPHFDWTSEIHLFESGNFQPKTHVPISTGNLFDQANWLLSETENRKAANQHQSILSRAFQAFFGKVTLVSYPRKLQRKLLNLLLNSWCLNKALLECLTFLSTSIAEKEGSLKIGQIRTTDQQEGGSEKRWERQA